ncbi:hypothetical protein BIW11_08670 [Tropilaelaps mercedesae]|uniref:Uncharacterized protein n=1 Tax=Tropilaelaps mercedesae TaxID=418985 RepID=A0A1V9XNK4_9ACAR|nr:hypothetical protein BIW11_08670 [Tropilaelaps mercedesae]
MNKTCDFGSFEASPQGKRELVTIPGVNSNTPLVETDGFFPWLPSEPGNEKKDLVSGRQQGLNMGRGGVRKQYLLKAPSREPLTLMSYEKNVLRGPRL